MREKLTITDKDIKAAKQMCPTSQKKIYDAYRVMVYSIAKRIFLNTGYAEDILQETFIDVFTKLGTFEGKHYQLGAWIKRIATNRSLMMLRTAWISRKSDEEIEEVPYQSFEDQLQNNQELEIALATLNPVSRSVLWLHDVEGYTHAEIGKMMKKTESFSKSQLARTHKKIKELLETNQTTNINVKEYR